MTERTRLIIAAQEFKRIITSFQVQAIQAIVQHAELLFDAPIVAGEAVEVMNN